jgi:hypothetical protein
MKFALIAPNEAGRLCQVDTTPFPVAWPLFWIECPDDVTADTHDYVDGDFVPRPPRASVAPQISSSTTGVEEL